jgi:hypothetical protein
VQPEAGRLDGRGQSGLSNQNEASCLSRLACGDTP